MLGFVCFPAYSTHFSTVFFQLCKRVVSWPSFPERTSTGRLFSAPNWNMLGKHIPNKFSEIRIIFFLISFSYWYFRYNIYDMKFKCLISLNIIQLNLTFLRGSRQRLTLYNRLWLTIAKLFVQLGRDAKFYSILLLHQIGKEDHTFKN